MTYIVDLDPYELHPRGYKIKVFNDFIDEC